MDYFIKKIIPKKIISYLKNKRTLHQNKRINKLPRLNISDLKAIITDKLNIKLGDTVLIHSSLGSLNLDIPPFDLLNLLINIVGENGTIIFPTYPKLTSYKFLESNNVFNIHKTPSYMGILTELARRHPDAKRSLHPTKSVVAIGKEAIYLTKDHQKDIYPYGVNSPYFRINEFNGKIIGIGVSTRNLSCVHCVDDYMKENFPVMPYSEKVFDAQCIDKDGKNVIVKTYAHLMTKMNFNIPKFIRKYINSDICQDYDIDGMKFFRADSTKLFEKLLSLAKEGKTIYNKKHYKGG